MLPIHVCESDAKQVSSQHWQDVIAETENVLQVTTAGGYIYATI